LKAIKSSCGPNPRVPLRVYAVSAKELGAVAARSTLISRSCAMNGNALRLQRTIEKHKIIGPDTAPFIYYIEDTAPYANLIEPAFSLLENQKLRAVTSILTLAEILTKPLAKKNLPWSTKSSSP
jgi:hypothetical protein